MKRFKFFICLLIGSACLFSACKKKTICIDDIVQTDDSGNVIDRGNSTDWVVQDINGDSHYQELQDLLSTLLAQRGITPVYQNCISSTLDSVSFMVYPNPTLWTNNTRLRIVSSQPILDFAFSYRPINSSIESVSGGVTTLSSDSTEINLPLSSLLNQNPTTDIEVYCMLLTRDFCTYFAKGKVKFLD